MASRYQGGEGVVTQAARSVRVSFQLRNDSRVPWPARSTAIGWQLYDPDSGLFLREGQWSELEADLAPGQTRAAVVDVEFPRERGRYYVYVSLIENGAEWQYARGERFLLVAAEVGQEQVQLRKVCETTLAALRRAARRQAWVEVLAGPWRTLWQYRGLARSLVRRDLQARYRGSVGDVLWTLLNPLLLMVTYFFVFGVVLQARFGNDPSRSGFVLYFLAGMLPWLAFSEALGRAATVVVEHRNFVKKLLFPVEILPVNPVWTGLVTEAFALAIFLIGLMLARGAVPPTVLLLPLLLIPQFLFTAGLNWGLAAIGVYFRDLGHIAGFLLTLWFFLTPICYPETQLPKESLWLLGKNPMFTLVRGYRAILLEGQPPEWAALWKLWVLGAVVFAGGYAVFARLRRSFADVL